MLLLWCFGITLLAERPDETRHLQSSRASFALPGPTATATVAATLEKQWKTRSGRKVFGSMEKLQKTIHLTSLSVLCAMKGNDGISDEEVIEAIRVAVRTLQFADQAALEGWSKSDSRAMEPVLRLPSKISQMNMNPAVQLEAICFYATIARKGNLALEVVTQYERCLANIASLVDVDCLDETLSISLPMFAVSALSRSVGDPLIATATNGTNVCPSIGRRGSGHMYLARGRPPLVKLHYASRANHENPAQIRLPPGQSLIRSSFRGATD